MRDDTASGSIRSFLTPSSLSVARVDGRLEKEAGEIENMLKKLLRGPRGEFHYSPHSVRQNLVSGMGKCTCDVCWK